MLRSNPPKEDFKGHTYIRKVGDALTPPRFWEVILLTKEEYDRQSDEIKSSFKRITYNDMALIKMHFGDE